MFEGKLNKSSVLKKILDAIKDLINEGCFECTEDGMMLQGMDNSHVCLISLTLNASGFDQFRCDRDVNLGMNLVGFSKIIKCADNDDSVLIKYLEDSDYLNLIFENDSQNQSSKVDMNLLVLDQEHLSIPETKFNCVVAMPSDVFQKIIRDLSQFGEQIQITCLKTSIEFSTKGDLAKFSKVLQNNSSLEVSEAVSIMNDKTISLSFACKYLLAFTKATPLSPKVTLSISENVPLVVEYVIPDIGNICYYLAPKIEDDNME